MFLYTGTIADHKNFVFSINKIIKILEETKQSV